MPLSPLKVMNAASKHGSPFLVGRMRRTQVSHYLKMGLIGGAAIEKHS